MKSLNLTYTVTSCLIKRKLIWRDTDIDLVLVLINVGRSRRGGRGGLGLGVAVLSVVVIGVCCGHLGAVRFAGVVAEEVDWR